MRHKNTMKLWQMLTLAILLFVVVMSMFLPIASLKGSNVVDAILDAAVQLQDKGEIDIPGFDKLKGIDAETIRKIDRNDQKILDQMVKELDEGIEKSEEKSGIRWSALSGIRFITMDTNAFLLGTEDYKREDVEEIDENEGYSELKRAITIYKIVFAVVYFGAIVILLLVLLGFVVKWSKYTMAIVSSAFGAATSVVFALYRWRTPSEILSYNGITNENVKLVVKIFWKAISGMGVMTCFILGILIFVMGIVTCIIGRASEQSGFSQKVSGWRDEGQGWETPAFPSNPFPPVNMPPVYNPVKLDPKPAVKPEPPQTPKPQYGRVKCTQGAAMGQGFKLPEDRKVIIGKSPQNATLVIHDQHVSNVHCSIRYRQETNSYIVKDHSTNGTFVQGVRLAKEVAMEYPAGTVLSLADGTNKITLG